MFSLITKNASAATTFADKVNTFYDTLRKCITHIYKIHSQHFEFSLLYTSSCTLSLFLQFRAHEPKE